MMIWTLCVWVTLSNLLWTVDAHFAAWHKGMYCLNGTDAGKEDPDTNSAVQPLFHMNQSDWWFHHSNKCDEFPPAPGDFLELPANGNFTVELAVNRAFTTLSYGGSRVALFGDGKDHPGLGVTQDGKTTNDSCISEPNIHTQNETMAAGTIFAISYVSDLKKVTMDNLAVFTALYHTPWHRVATYQVPNLPACPDDGCICVWGWVPNGCGIPNMYMQGFRCKVTGVTGNAAIDKAVPPVWCEDDVKKCVKGAKQIVVWHQLEGNNVQVDGFDLAGDNKSPSYNMKMGFAEGAQTDIFLQAGTAPVQNVPQAGDTSKAKGSAKATTLSAELSGSLILGLFVMVGLLVRTGLPWL